MSRMSRNKAESARVCVAGRQGSGRRAFTLAEVIVAIAILAIIGVVMGSIFASVGDTVTNGRQVSNLNRFAARVERVMRNDFENMVRENGFMVIRNEISNDYSGINPTPHAVGLTVTDPNPRPRRIDELMFFSRGDFTSRRTPLHPDLVARADVARIYYGHGQQMPEDLGADPDAPDYTTRYARPRLDEMMANIMVDGSMVDSRLGRPSALGVVNPNEFASNWSLLRHVTLLVPRSSGVQNLPSNVFELRPREQDAEYYRIADSSRQVALGPATQSIFKSIAVTQPYEFLALPTSPVQVFDNPPNGFSIRLNELSMLVGNGVDGTLVRPLPMSGVVDVAVTDLGEIRRRIVNTVYNTGSLQELTPAQVNPASAFVGGAYTRSDLDTQRVGFDIDGNPYVGTTQIDFQSGGVYATDPSFVAQAQQRWMLDALPSVPYDGSAPPQATGQRVRYEDVPPRVYLDDGTQSNDPEVRRQAAIEQADQEMLASSVFVPRCTEFIVEFSFGIVDRRTTSPNYGQQIWHGLRRTAGGEIVVDGFGTEFGTEDLLDDPTTQNDLFALAGAFPASSFEDGNRAVNQTASSTAAGYDGIDQEIIDLVWVRDNQSLTTPMGDENILQYCFGYSYRDWNLNSQADQNDSDGTNDYLAGDDDDVEREWPWPTMVRVTMRFVDPADLEDEQTFQFEFRVPGLRGRL